MNKFLVRENRDLSLTIVTDEGKIIASIQPDHWASTFFNRLWGTLRIEGGIKSFLCDQDACTPLENLLNMADEKKFKNLEFRCDVSELEVIPKIEDMGFRLVDTAITFLTLIKKPISFDYSVLEGQVVPAKPEDLKPILQLTNECFNKNQNFFSRYKNRLFFTSEETERYYSTWIENHLEDPSTFFVVTNASGRITGYFIYKRTRFHDDTPVYKGILTAVAQDCRGRQLHLSMQRHIYDLIPEEKFYVENATRLNNFPAIINHMRSNKSLHQIELIFYRPLSFLKSTILLVFVPDCMFFIPHIFDVLENF